MEMALEIDNILRSLAEIKKAIFLLDYQITTAEQTIAKQEMTRLTDELEHETRVLEYEWK